MRSGSCERRRTLSSGRRREPARAVRRPGPGAREGGREPPSRGRSGRARDRLRGPDPARDRIPRVVVELAGRRPLPAIADAERLERRLDVADAPGVKGAKLMLFGTPTSFPSRFCAKRASTRCSDSVAIASAHSRALKASRRRVISVTPTRYMLSSIVSTASIAANSPTPPAPNAASGTQKRDVSGCAPTASSARTWSNSVATAARSTGRNCSEGVPGARRTASDTTVTPNSSCVMMKSSTRFWKSRVWV